MIQPTRRLRDLPTDICQRALDARDARFDGLFFVGIVTTKIYCRPTCPSRRADPHHRRFFGSPAAAERAGFRPCLRCRPELAPGRAVSDAVSRLAKTAAFRIGAGALNGHSVAELASDLGVSERHLRRALQREIGVSPVDLAQTHRLLLAKRLLADTALPVTRVAFASGFQSLRRFNVAFRERYGMSPSALRRPPALRLAGGAGSAAGGAAVASRGASPAGSGPARAAGGAPSAAGGAAHETGRAAFGIRRAASDADRAPSRADRAASGTAPAASAISSSPAEGTRDLLRMTLAYRAPFAWDALLDCLGHEALPGVEIAAARRYVRTVRVDGRSGVVLAQDSPAERQLKVDVSLSLLPVLMPVLARLRRLFDLDAEPAAVDGHLKQGGLARLVRRRPGLRLPGAFDGFGAALGVLLRAPMPSSATAREVAGRVAASLGEPLDTGIRGLDRLAPSPERVADPGASRLVTLGVLPRRAEAVSAVACLVANGDLRLEPGSDPAHTLRALAGIEGLGERLATRIVMRALSWPDAFPASDVELQRAAGAADGDTLLARAERWRPWRAYAAIHLDLERESPVRVGSRQPGPGVSRLPDARLASAAGRAVSRSEREPARPRLSGEVKGTR